MKKIKWPQGKSFAFTIIDDTEYSYIDNVKPVYDLLHSLNLKTTKTVWIYPPRDHFKGLSLSDNTYCSFVKDLEKKGFEITLHGVGSGFFKRDEIIDGIEKFNSLMGYYPRIHINHANNPDNVYWGFKRFVPPLSWLFNIIFYKRKLEGELEKSPHYWGDMFKKHMEYTRNHVFNGINTQQYDNIMPYKVKNKKYGNYWFSSSDGHTVKEFNYHLSKKNIDLLEQEGGYCIIYTHFGIGFTDKNNELNEEFKACLSYLSSKNGWFVPAGELLDYVKNQRSVKYASYLNLLKLDLLWLKDRVMKKLKFGN
jgi:hypothetical protein